jgi:6-phosphogluconolactonase (cycloisomerase 2 family)
MVAGASGAFTDSISGPRALAFSPDGKLLLMANSASEDVMVFDGTTGNVAVGELALIRPPSKLPETWMCYSSIRRAPSLLATAKLQLFIQRLA